MRTAGLMGRTPEENLKFSEAGYESRNSSTVESCDRNKRNELYIQFIDERKMILSIQVTVKECLLQSNKVI